MRRSVEGGWKRSKRNLAGHLSYFPSGSVGGRWKSAPLLAEELASGLPCGLELADPGFDASVLCEFRKRLVQGSAEHLLFDTLLDVCKQQGWLKARERQRTDSTHVLAKVRAINRLMCVGEAMRFALNSLAVAAPDWLLPHSDTQCSKCIECN